MSETLTTTENEVRTYRGGSIEELLPRIREDLGPEAVILRQREGLVGGVGGFFQRKCVEVDARAGGPGIDVYDEEPADFLAPRPVPPAPTSDAADGAAPVRNDAATREGLASPAVRQLVEEAQPFADLLGELGEAAAAAEAEARVEPEAKRGARAEALRDGMVAVGLGADLAAEVVDAVTASAMPFATPARLRTLVRDQLALRIPVAPAAAPGRRALALVGPAGAGKTAAAAAICAAHAAAGDPVTCLALAPADGGVALRRLLADTSVRLLVAETPDHHREGDGAREGEPELLVVDTPPAWVQAPALPRLAGALEALRLDEVHAVVRAGTAAAAAGELLAGLGPLAPDRLLATGLGETRHLGAIADVAIRHELPLSYLAEDAATIAPADPRALASRITP